MKYLGVEVGPLPRCNWGRHDRVLDVSCTEAMAASIPDNKIVIFEDAGHVPMIEKPGDSAAHQLELITAHRAAETLR